VGVLSLAHTEEVREDARMLRWGASLANYVASFTERVRAIAAIRENETRYRSLAEDLQRANQELEAFGYTVSHDLRAPLRTMQGFAHTLLQKFEPVLPPDAVDYTRRILASGEQAEKLIRDLLAYSKLTLKEIQRVPVELSVVVSTASSQLTNDIEEARARVDVAGELPVVLGDHTTLVQVVSNLVSNAVKFAREGVTPRVRIRAEPRGDEVRLWIEDNGVGIPADQVEKIFRTFERLTQTQARPGTGIGLAIVRRGMERIGGTSGVEAKPGEGSRFWIQLPAHGSA
jgi:signal transduction histidine kinase